MSTGVVTTGSTPRLLISAMISNLFGMEYKQHKAVHPLIYDKKSSSQNFEEAVLLQGLGVASRKNEGSTIALDSYKQAAARRTVHQVWGKALKVTMEQFEDNLHMNVAQVASKELAKALFHAKEINAAAIFNNATSTSAPYVGWDAVALLSTAHPTGLGSTFTNRASTDFSELALEQAVIDILGWIGYDGLRVNVNHDNLKLLIPRQELFNVHRILKSDLQSNSAEHNANAVKDMGIVSQIIPWVFLTDSDAWFVLTGERGLCYYDRQAPKTHHYQEDSTMDSIYQIYERYSFDHFDPHAVYGSPGA